MIFRTYKSISGDGQQYQLRENAAEFGSSRSQRLNSTADVCSGFNNTFFWGNWEIS